MNIIAIVGARPQFIKHFPIEMCFKKHKYALKTIHTGQHYDENMSEIFFTQLGMNKPDYMLNIDNSSHATQTASMMLQIENILIDENPDGIILYGDTNSTLAGAITASKLSIPIFHIEAGLRSFNKEMPEEINRVLTDHISSILFTPSDISIKNLKSEGIVKNVINVGDIMKELLIYVVESKLIKKK